jgi:hypothetical protein
MTLIAPSNTQDVYGRETAALGGDLLWGVKGIAAEIDRTERQTYHMLVTGQLPAQLIGGRWVASRSGLRQRFAQVLGGPAA